MHRVPPDMTRLARSLRNGATPAERTLWRVLSPFRPRSTRQLVVGRCIVDIAHRQAKVAIELDGGQHAERTEADAGRAGLLEGLGWIVLRFWNNDVMVNVEGVADTVLSAMAQRLPSGTHPRPLSCREGRRQGPS